MTTVIRKFKKSGNLVFEVLGKAHKNGIIKDNESRRGSKEAGSIF